MDILVTDRDLKRELLRRRRESGGDRWDEVWDGVYIMSPLADIQHQFLETRFTSLLDSLLGMTGLAQVFGGLNVSDRNEGRRRNYRVPDVAVVMDGSQARITKTHCIGGPDFVIEVRSFKDRTRKKIPFYASIGVRELLIVDREPWALELHRLEGGGLRFAGRSTVEDGAWVESAMVPLSFRLIEGAVRQAVEVVHRRDGRSWVV